MRDILLKYESPRLSFATLELASDVLVPASSIYAGEAESETAKVGVINGVGGIENSTLDTTTLTVSW